jgi:hypothetical protein
VAALRAGLGFPAFRSHLSSLVVTNGAPVCGELIVMIPTVRVQIPTGVENPTVLCALSYVLSEG